jgi:hypothetical protein
MNILTQVLYLSSLSWYILSVWSKHGPYQADVTCSAHVVTQKHTAVHHIKITNYDSNLQSFGQKEYHFFWKETKD